MIALALACIVALAWIGGCALSRCGAYAFPYNWENLATENGRYVYRVDGQAASRIGIDVSSSQGDIDWQAVASDGVEFAFVRAGWRGATEGGIYEDDRFAYNLQEAQAVGIDVGAYFFSQAINEDEAREEARFVLNALDGANLECPVVYDMEPLAALPGRTVGMDQSTLIACARAFCAVIETAGYSTMIYGNDTDLTSLYGQDYLRGSNVWIAEYGACPTTSYDFSIWQYTDNGQVDGIDTACDIDLDLSEALKKR